jgi:mRNA-degrading endonuclease toxin of MazEF toxin-antitoxin module
LPATPPVPACVAERRPQRDDIYWLDVKPKQTEGSEQHGYRPWVVMSVNSINNQLPIVVAVPLSEQVHKIQGARLFSILIPEEEKIQEPAHPKGCKGQSLALTEQVRVLSISRIKGPRAATLAPKAIAAIEVGLAFVLQIR